ncbi:MAG: tRNA epoxyqueuosine(34) reductase QueG [Phycisphaerae bacterium]
MTNASEIKTMALAAGFDLVGIAPAHASEYAQAYQEWLALGRHGQMHYMAENVPTRLDPKIRFPWLRSVICLALHYQPTPMPPCPPTQGKIARYAWGRDYHKVLTNKLRRLHRDLTAREATLEARAYVDTGPIMEREFSARAGLGWIGKNTLLISPRHGSYFVLGVLLTNLTLEFDRPEPDHCGTCTRCLTACPTQALTPYKLDASRCLSYLTNEHKGDIAEELKSPMAQAGYIVGCDICQEVCPHNRHAPQTTTQDFLPRQPGPILELAQILDWDVQKWDQATQGRAFRRVKLTQWQRNATILKNETQPGLSKLE